MKKIWIIIGVIVVLAIGGIVWSYSMNKNPSTSTPNVASAAATIVYSDSGFSPATTTVKSGDTVAIKNTSSSTMQLDSDPHPVHTDDTDLNVGQVAAGETKAFVVTKKGNFGFHNHLAPSNTAKLVVQ